MKISEEINALIDVAQEEKQINDNRPKEAGDVKPSGGLLNQEALESLKKPDLKKVALEEGDKGDLRAIEKGKEYVKSLKDSVKNNTQLILSGRKLMEELAKPGEARDIAAIRQLVDQIKSCVGGAKDFREILVKAEALDRQVSGKVQEAPVPPLELLLSAEDLEAMRGGAAVGDCNRSLEAARLSLQQLETRLNQPVFSAEAAVPEDLKPVFTSIVMLARWDQVQAEARAVQCLEAEQALINDFDELRHLDGEAFDQKRGEIEAKLEQSRLWRDSLHDAMKFSTLNTAQRALVAQALDDCTPLDQQQFDYLKGTFDSIVVEKIAAKYDQYLSAGKGVLGTFADVVKLVAQKAGQAPQVSSQKLMQALMNGAKSFSLPGLNETALCQMRIDLMLTVLQFDVDAEVEETLSKVAQPVERGVREQQAALARGRLLQHVDLLFQTGYPLLSADAVEVKKALLPGHLEDVTVQHTAMLAHRRLMSLLQQDVTDGKDKVTFKTSKKVASNLGGITDVSARGFLLTPELVEALKKGTKEGVKLPVEQLNYQIADLAMLQFQMIDRHLIPAPVVEKSVVPSQGGRQQVDGFEVVGSGKHDHVSADPLKAEWTIIEQAQEGDQAAPVQNGPKEIQHEVIRLVDLLPSQRRIQDLLQKPVQSRTEAESLELQNLLSVSVQTQINNKIVELGGKADKTAADNKLLEALMSLPLETRLEAEIQRLERVPGSEEALREARAELKSVTGYKKEVEGLGSFQGWCTSLGLKMEVRDVARAFEEYQEFIADPQASLAKAQALYGKGLVSSTAHKQVAKDLSKAGALRADSKKLREISGDVPLAVALNKRLVDLSGLVAASDRIDDPANGLKVNPEKIKQAMKAQTQALLDRIWGRDKYREFLAAGGLLGDVRNLAIDRRCALEREIAGLTAFGDKLSTEIKLGHVKSNIEQRRSQMEAAKNTIGRRSWYNRLSFLGMGHGFRKLGNAQQERLNISQIVVAYAQAKEALLAAKAKNPVDPVDVEEIRMREQAMESLRSALTGVDPTKLVKVEGFGEPTDEDIMNSMLSRAKAYEYFHLPRPEHGGKTQAEKDAEDLGIAQAGYKSFKADRERLEKPLDAAIGEEAKTQLDNIMWAAILLAAQGSGKPVQAFRATSKESLEAIAKILEDWGLHCRDCGHLVRNLLVSSLNKYVHSDGRLRMSKIRDEAKYRARMRLEPGKAALNRYEATKQPGDASFKDQVAPKAAMYREGARSIMERVRESGTSFAYSRTLGLAIDTGTIYTPFTGIWNKTADSLLFKPVNTTKLNLLQYGINGDKKNAIGFSGSIFGGGKEGFLITKKGNSYEVTVRGDGFVNLGIGAGWSFPGGPLKGTTLLAKSTINAQQSYRGVVLNFTDERACEDFVELLINSSEKKANAEKVEEVLMKASQIRTFSEGGLSGDLTLTAMFGVKHDFVTWNPGGLDNNLNLQVGLSAQLNTGLGYKSKVVDTASGSTLTKHWDYKFSIGAAAKAEFSGIRKDENNGIARQAGAKVVNQPLANGKLIDIVGSIDYSVVTDETGLSENCSVTTSTKINYLNAGLELTDGWSKMKKLSSVTKAGFKTHLTLGQMNKLKKADPDFERKFSDLLDDIKPNETLSVVHKISKSALAQIREKLAEIRGREKLSNAVDKHGNPLNMASAQERSDQLMREIQDILGNRDNYVPAEIKITSADSADVRTYSPGLLLVQLVRQSQMTITKTRTGLTISLPEVE